MITQFRATLFLIGFLLVMPSSSLLAQFADDGSLPPPNRIEGELARGASTWHADFQLNTPEFTAGDTLQLALDVVLNLPDFDASLPTRFAGDIALHRVAMANGNPIASPNAAWSSSATRSVLPVLGVPRDMIPLGSARAVSPRLVEATDDAPQRIYFRLLFNVPIPDDLPDGWYQIVFKGEARIADSTPFDWYDNRIFGIDGEGVMGDSSTVLPRWLRIGLAQPPQLLVALFDTVVASAASARALAQDQLISPLPIRPPAIYELLPRVLSDDVQFALPSGEIGAEIIAPDGTKSVLGALPIAEQIRGDSGEVLLTTADPRFIIDFNQYGVYNITLTGNVRDTFGLTHHFGGTYTLAIADPFALETGILPATPLTVGDALIPSLNVTPAIPADVRVVITIYPLDGSDPITTQYDGTTNHYGYFTSEALELNTTGEYVIDYRASATRENRVYAATRRIAGVITEPDAPLAYGQRGLIGDNDATAQAWYDTAVYPDASPDLPPYVYAPFFAGDILYLPDDETFRLQPIITRANNLPTYAQRQYALSGLSQPAIVWHQYAFAESRPPQFSPDATNTHIGSGVAGLRLGDYGFLMGGWVEPEATYGYASALIITDEDSARIMPPFQRPLMISDGREWWMRFYASALHDGSILQVGDPITIAGYTLPPVPATAQITLIRPSGGIITTQEPVATNPWGYLHFNPSITADEPGIWRVIMDIETASATSAGSLNAPVQERIESVFYVVDTVLVLDDGLESIRPIAPLQNLTFNFSVPDGWQDIRAHYTMRTPSETLNSEPASVFGTTISISLNRADLTRRFPSLEASGQGDTPSASDAVHIALYVQGTTPEGNIQHTARHMTIWHNTLYTFED